MATTKWDLCEPQRESRIIRSIWRLVRRHTAAVDFMSEKGYVGAFSEGLWLQRTLVNGKQFSLVEEGNWRKQKIHISIVPLVLRLLEKHFSSIIKLAKAWNLFHLSTLAGTRKSRLHDDDVKLSNLGFLLEKEKKEVSVCCRLSNHSESSVHWSARAQKFVCDLSWQRRND